jgi:hypothetical protein
MKLNKVQKAKIVLWFSLSALFFAILFIPSFVNTSTSWASEDSLETIFLVLSFFSVVYVFWHYDYVVQKREQENFKLTSKLKSKERELLETFQYLGKVNVRFSVIRDLLNRMKKPAPTTQEELKETLKSLLNIACSATGKEKAWLKIINTKNRKVLVDEYGGNSFSEEGQKNQISVSSLIEVYKKNKKNQFDEMKVFCSDLDNFYIKAFLILSTEEDLVDQEGDFLKAVANQCEILFLLFDSQYYRPKNKK